MFCEPDCVEGCCVECHGDEESLNVRPCNIGCRLERTEEIVTGSRDRTFAGQQILEAFPHLSWSGVEPLSQTDWFLQLDLHCHATLLDDTFTHMGTVHRDRNAGAPKDFGVANARTLEEQRALDRSTRGQNL